MIGGNGVDDFELSPIILLAQGGLVTDDGADARELSRFGGCFGHGVVPLGRTLTPLSLAVRVRV